MLTEGDDLYLLRLVVQTGPCSKLLSQDSTRQVLDRLNKIVRRGVFDAVEVEWIDDAKREGHLKQMSMHEQNEYMDTLYWLQSG